MLCERGVWSSCSKVRVDVIGFFDIIQAYFTKLTGRFMMFSGRDMDLLERWRGQGATAVAICRGIRDAVMHMDQRDPPRDLYNCRDFIEPYVERARARSGELSEFSSEAIFGVASLSDKPLVAPHGASSTTINRKPLNVAQRALIRIERAGQRCEQAEVRALYREVWYGVKDATKRVSVEEQYGALLELEERLADAYFEVLSGGHKAQIERRLVDEVNRHGLRMSEEAWACHKAARRRYLMVREYGLVSLLD